MKLGLYAVRIESILEARSNQIAKNDFRNFLSATVFVVAINCINCSCKFVVITFCFAVQSFNIKY